MTKYILNKRFPLENADFLADSDEDDFVVTIGEIKSNVPFKNQPTGGGTLGVKPELDGMPSFKGTQIYDLDLATMEDKPWRKPGADITDYFNFGFNEGINFYFILYS